MFIAHPYNHILHLNVKARLPIELDLPPHKCQADKDDNSMVNSKLLGEKRTAKTDDCMSLQTVNMALFSEETSALLDIDMHFSVFTV